MVLCNSESLRAQALALGVAPAAKLQLLGEAAATAWTRSGFAPGPSDVREQLRLGHDDLVVGFVGRLTRDKGLPELVEAFEKIAARRAAGAAAAGGLV